ncbi:MAG: hypothetical protein WAR83_03670 [Flavobacteriales bacterium]
MKTIKSNLLMASIVAGSFMVVSCNETPAEQRDDMNDKVEKIEDKAQDAMGDRDWESERNEIREDFRDLQTKIDNKLAEVNEDLTKTDLKADVRAKKEAMKVELIREKDMIAEKMRNVDGATNETWDMTKSDVENTKRDIDSWWEKQKENVDVKTDADNDNDGH